MHHCYVLQLFFPFANFLVEINVQILKSGLNPKYEQFLYTGFFITTRCLYCTMSLDMYYKYERGTIPIGAELE